jgi:hypothetical protein
MPRRFSLSEYPEYVEVFSDPVLGDLWLSPCIVAPQHMLEVLEAFGVKISEGLSDLEVKEVKERRRQLIFAVEDVAIKFRVAEIAQPPMDFTAANKHLSGLKR